jgi:hypothetical protein
MSRPGTIVFDQPPWWRRPRVVLGCLACASVVGALWWSAITLADDGEPLQRPQAHAPQLADAPLASPNTPPDATAPDERAAAVTAIEPPAPASAAPAAQIQASPLTATPLSTMVAPGVHVTPLGVPPGTQPVPAGPKAEDSEPEN